MTSISRAGTKGVPRAAREQQILDVAAEEIGRVGYAGLSLADVAARAGVSKPLVYAYFDSKDGLYVACVNRALGVLDAAAAQAITKATGVDVMQRTLEATFTALESRPNDWNVLLDRSHPVDGPAAEAAEHARGRIADATARGIALIFDSGSITDTDDLSALTDVWIGIVTSLVRWWLRHPEQSAEAMTARTRRIVSALFGSGDR